MILAGKFIMISIESNTRDGKTYHNVNVEAEDGKLLRIGADEVVLNKLQKYQLHSGFFNIGCYNNNFFVRLVDATPIAADKAKA